MHLKTAYLMYEGCKKEPVVPIAAEARDGVLFSLTHLRVPETVHCRALESAS
jgi:hypothetical protein